MSDAPLVLRAEPCTAPDPLQVFAAAGTAPRFYWEQPAARRFRVGVGSAARVTAAGPARFARIEADARKVLSRIDWQGDGHCVASLVGGFAFASDSGAGDPWVGFPAAELRLPELLYAGAGDRCTRILQDGSPWSALAPRPLALGGPVHGVAEFSGEGPEHYIARVRRALDEIHAGPLRKVVVARAAHAMARTAIDPVSWLVALRERFPSCTVFAVGEGDAVFLGATPERLVRMDGERVLTTAVAGTAARGASPAADRALGQALLDSGKDREEHTIVVRHLSAALSACCDDVRFDTVPGLVKNRTVQHLCTELTARQRTAAPVTLLDLVQRLHPSPAVGGEPVGAALEWLARHEPLERGWYAGPVGFLQSDGGGEFAVALRSALVRGRRATAWAGAGIVAQSDPEAEFTETELKLRAVLGPLLWGAP